MAAPTRTAFIAVSLDGCGFFSQPSSWRYASLPKEPADLAVADPEAFSAIAEQAKSALAS